MVNQKMISFKITFQNLDNLDDMIRNLTRWTNRNAELNRAVEMYVEYENVIKKTCPTRTVLENVANLYDTGDTLSIIEFNGKYGLLNTNDASFIIPARYDRMWHLSADIYMGVRCDSLYTITIPSGKIIKRESAEDLYTSIKPIPLSLEEYYFEDSDMLDALDGSYALRKHDEEVADDAHW